MPAANFRTGVYINPRPKARRRKVDVGVAIQLATLWTAIAAAVLSVIL